MRRLAATVLMFALGACGQQADLKPKAGQAMPGAPYGRGDKPTAEELLKVTSQAAPERSVELRKRSEERLQDPFDLPPSDE
ncbi:hypothetical protein [Novosphingobium sp.]|jgi:hypothetical protein|uniref:hypothetical protein n=1 Tax=Novosphingobium sp. TaxID=1874826 RepID=UPI001ED4AE38|nr:hypothetical protein [Novosphingobium sp.]MBK9011284.1 hypothetical protein [Novosphingobium sp.]